MIMITVIITIIVLDTSSIIFIRLTGVTTAVNYSTLLSLKSCPLSSILFYSFLRFFVYVCVPLLLLLLRLLFPFLSLFLFRFFFVLQLSFYLFVLIILSVQYLNRIVFITIIIVIHGNQWDVV